MTDLLRQPYTSAARLAQLTTRQFEKNAEPELCVDLLLPKDWMKFEPYRPEPPDAGGQILFGRYGSRDGKALLELRAEPILREVSSADWFAWMARRQRFVIEKSERTSGPAGFDIHAIAKRPGRSGAPFTFRMATFKDRAMVYLVSGFAHPQDFDVFQEPFVVAINSFQVTGSEGVPSAEPLRTVSLTRMLPVSFVIPQTWLRQVDPREDVELVHFENRAGNDALLGKLSVLVAPVAAYSSASEAAKALVAAERKPVSVTTRPGSPSALGRGFTGPEQGDVTWDVVDARHSVRVFAARFGLVWVAVSRWSHPASPEPFPVDAMNDRAYDIVLRTFRGT